jgi:P27 family predicted phage terminase small subunit
MGKGRKPKPKALLELEKGKLYSDQRDRAELEPTPKKEIRPRCPRRFSKAERKAWKELAAMLDNYGLLQAANAIQLELLATAWAQYVEVSEKLAQNPQIVVAVKDRDKETKAWMYNPYFNAQHKLGQLVDRYSQNLGLSSIQMAKIGSLMVKARREKSEMEELLD